MAADDIGKWGSAGHLRWQLATELEERLVTSTRVPTVSSADFDRAAQAVIDGTASDADLTLLRSDEELWEASLWRLLNRTEDALELVTATESGPGRANIIEDLDRECDRIDDALTALIGPPPAPVSDPAPKTETTAPADIEDPIPDEGEVQLQLSWAEGRLVAWAAGYRAEAESADALLRRLDALGGGAIAWEERDPIKLPGGGTAPTVSAQLTSTLGWLAALGDTASDEGVGATTTWMGLVTAAAIELVAQGKVVPQLMKFKGGRNGADDGLATFHVRWIPALVEPGIVSGLVDSLPGAAMVCTPHRDRPAFVNAVLADLADAIVRTAASQLDLPAPPPQARTRTDVGEAVICRLDGTAFRAMGTVGAEVVRRLSQWAQPVVKAPVDRLIVQLDPPDDMGAWHAAVLVSNADGVLEPVEVTLTTASKSRSKSVSKELDRLERVFPELLRPGGRRRGEVLLSQDEAWQLMTASGESLTAAGFDVRVPPLSRKRATASLRLTAEDAQETVVGAQQLANVRWSAVFDDVELSAADISRLAAEARPLVQSRGRWVELDKADLAEAAAALAERADKTRLTGADMLRHALGLEGSPFGSISIAGDAWAADLLRSLDDLPEHPEISPEHFVGELRSYQADALAWLDFLDDAGLGGCLALDMGLGKTPTTLANLAGDREHGSGLVVAPPAVVGNWAAEAARFTPDLDVLVHHGPNRKKGVRLRKAVEKADVVITTYGTAVRDMDQLCEIQWGKVVLDEAQAIKNPLAETSQQLRRLEARTRVALTGTPIENGLGDLWSILDWANPGLLGPRAAFIAQLTPENKVKGGGEEALKALNGILVYRRTKAEPAIAAELPDRIDELDHCAMTPEQIGLYQAVIDSLVVKANEQAAGTPERKGAVLAAITALKQICNHPVNYQDDGESLEGRSGKLERLNEIIDNVFAADERVLVFTHFATWGERLAVYLTERTGKKINCYHGGLGRGARDRMVANFQKSTTAGAMVLSLKAGGTGLNLTAANHVVLYDRWWNPAVEDQARDRVWRIGQDHTVICHRLVCPGTVDERVEEVVAGKRQIADLVLPKSSSIGDLDPTQLQQVLGIDDAMLLTADELSEMEAATS
ncbi:MAG: DEAD/DEAH box helicase [Acidimicrobiia bacterium]|nr:DEAD/DEAH box helicase [Acidimicrobiia bacterium]